MSEKPSTYEELLAKVELQKNQLIECARAFYDFRDKLTSELCAPMRKLEAENAALKNSEIL